MVRDSRAALSFSPPQPPLSPYHRYAIGEDIKFWAKNGVKAIFAEGSYGTSGGDMDALKDYLIGRLLWDPSLEPQALIDEFLLG